MVRLLLLDMASSKGSLCCLSSSTTHTHCMQESHFPVCGYGLMAITCWAVPWHSVLSRSRLSRRSMQVASLGAGSAPVPYWRPSKAVLPDRRGQAARDPLSRDTRLALQHSS
jgi:hypothetical protein